MAHTDLTEMLEAELRAIRGGEYTAPNAEPAKPEPVAKKHEVFPHTAWPGFAMFSVVFGMLPGGKSVDIPVPQFKPTDWPEQARAMIPALPSHWVHNLDVMYDLALAVLQGDTTLLTGPTGTGKTSSIVAFAAECCIPVWITSAYRRMEHTDFIGSASLRADPKTGANITEYNPTQLVNSLWHGGIAVVDEAFRSPCLMTIQSLLEDKHTLVLADADGLAENERVLQAKPGLWWIMLTDNTTGTGDTTGAYNAEVQDLSTLDRITSTINVPYPSATIEAEIIRKAYPDVTSSVATGMVRVATEVRKAHQRAAMMQTMSMRALLSWASKYVIMRDVEQAFKQAFYAKLDTDSAAVCSELYRQVTGRSL